MKKLNLPTGINNLEDLANELGHQNIHSILSEKQLLKFIEDLLSYSSTEFIDKFNKKYKKGE